jgi:predicted RNA-binding protein with TRAM domain
MYNFKKNSLNISIVIIVIFIIICSNLGVLLTITSRNSFVRAIAIKITPYIFFTPYSADSVPGTPQNLDTMSGNESVTLTWQAPTDDGGSPIINYKIYRGNSSGAETLIKTIGNVTNYIDTGLTNGNIYYYEVSAVNSVGEGPRSIEKIHTPVTIPIAPQHIVATSGNGQITLTWETPSDNGGSSIMNYNLFRGTMSGEELFITPMGNVTSYIDKGLINGQIYYYEINAVTVAGEGLISIEINATPSNISTNSSTNTLNTTPISIFDSDYIIGGIILIIIIAGIFISIAVVKKRNSNINN